MKPNTHIASATCEPAGRSNVILLSRGGVEKVTLSFVVGFRFAGSSVCMPPATPTSPSQQILMLGNTNTDDHRNLVHAQSEACLRQALDCGKMCQDLLTSRHVKVQYVSCIPLGGG